MDAGAQRPLADQVAIVTGAGQGLGKALCRGLALAGAHVIVADINFAAAQSAAGEIAAATDRRLLPAPVDVTDEAQVAGLVRQAETTFGRIDLLVANAGIVESGPVAGFALDCWQRVVDVNLTGYFLCAKHVAPVMKRQRSGTIIQINSISGKRGSARNPAYCATKAAGIGLTQSLALELAEFGVRVNAVCPGHLLDSPLWVNSLFKQYAVRYNLTEAQVRQKYIDAVPLRRPCTYDDVIAAVVFLASPQASYLTGQALSVTGGEQMS